MDRVHIDLPEGCLPLADEASGLRLVLPSSRYLDSYRQACEETWDHIHNRYILHDPKRFDQWRTTIFSTYEDRFAGVNLPDGYYPSLTLWGVGTLGASAVDESSPEGESPSFIGAVNIRTRQGEDLLRYGGTVGFFVRTSCRQRGFGLALAQMAMQVAIALDVHPVLLTCQESNRASRSICERVNHIREERAIEDVDGIVQPIWRYWVRM